MRFAAAITCIDGRIQEPTAAYIKKRFNVDFVDTITEAGPNLILAKQTNFVLVDSIFERLMISVGHHHSIGVAIVGHSDCAGNPLPMEKQTVHTLEAVELVRSRCRAIEIVGLWVDDNRMVSEIKDSKWGGDMKVSRENMSQNRKKGMFTGWLAFWQTGLILSVFLLSSYVHSLSAFAEARTVISKGVATVTKGNKAMARDSATNDALKRAVEQAVGVLVSSETLVENYEVLSDSIYAKSHGYVRDYRIINEGMLGGTLYQVTVEATIDSADIKNDLGALGLLHKQVEKPRILFMIAEQNIGQKFYLFWWWGKIEYKSEEVNLSAAETILSEDFLSNGFNVIDVSAVTGRIVTSKAFKIADITNKGARSIASQLGAEIVVRGKAIAKEGPRNPGSSVSAYLADITATAIRVDNGQIIASARGHGVSRNVSEVTGGTEAIERAARELSGQLIDSIIAKWTVEASGARIVQVTVVGIKEFNDLVMFKEILKSQVRSVRSIYQRSFNGDMAVLDVEVKTTTRSFADDVATRDYGFPVSITRTTSKTVAVRIGN